MKKNILFLVAATLIICGCSMSIEKTYVEGNNDKVVEESKNESEANVKANVKVPASIL